MDPAPKLASLNQQQHRKTVEVERQGLKPEGQFPRAVDKLHSKVEGRQLHS